MSLLSSDIHKFIQFLNLTQDKITTLYRSKLEITEWNHQDYKKKEPIFDFR